MKAKIQNTAMVGDRVRHPRFSVAAKVLQERPAGMLLVEFDHGMNDQGVPIRTLGEYPAGEFTREETGN